MKKQDTDHTGSVSTGCQDARCFKAREGRARRQRAPSDRALRVIGQQAGRTIRLEGLPDRVLARLARGRVELLVGHAPQHAPASAATAAGSHQRSEIGEAIPRRGHDYKIGHLTPASLTFSVFIRYLRRKCAASPRGALSFHTHAVSILPFAWQLAARTQGKPMAKATTIKIRLVSSADTGHFYVTKKNSRTMTEKMVKKKYDPVARKHVEYRESKIK